MCDVFVIREGCGCLSVLGVRVHRRWPVRTVRWNQLHLLLPRTFTRVIHPVCGEKADEASADKPNVKTSSCSSFVLFVCCSSPPPLLPQVYVLNNRPWVLRLQHAQTGLNIDVTIKHEGVVYSIYEVKPCWGFLQGSDKEEEFSTVESASFTFIKNTIQDKKVGLI